MLTVNVNRGVITSVQDNRRASSLDCCVQGRSLLKYIDALVLTVQSHEWQCIASYYVYKDIKRCNKEDRYVVALYGDIESSGLCGLLPHIILLSSGL